MRGIDILPKVKWVLDDLGLDGEWVKGIGEEGWFGQGYALGMKHLDLHGWWGCG